MATGSSMQLTKHDFAHMKMLWRFMNKPSKQYHILLTFGSVTVALVYVHMKILHILEGEENMSVTCVC